MEKRKRQRKSSEDEEEEEEQDRELEYLVAEPVPKVSMRKNKVPRRTAISTRGARIVHGRKVLPPESSPSSNERELIVIQDYSSSPLSPPVLCQSSSSPLKAKTSSLNSAPSSLSYAVASSSTATASASDGVIIIPSSSSSSSSPPPSKTLKGKKKNDVRIRTSAKTTRAKCLGDLKDYSVEGDEVGDYRLSSIGSPPPQPQPLNKKSKLSSSSSSYIDDDIIITSSRKGKQRHVDLDGIDDGEDDDVRVILNNSTTRPLISTTATTTTTNTTTFQPNTKPSRAWRNLDNTSSTTTSNINKYYDDDIVAISSSSSSSSLLTRNNNNNSKISDVSLSDEQLAQLLQDEEYRVLQPTDINQQLYSLSHILAESEYEAASDAAGGSSSRGGAGGSSSSSSSRRRRGLYSNHEHHHHHRASSSSASNSRRNSPPGRSARQHFASAFSILHSSRNGQHGPVPLDDYFFNQVFRGGRGGGRGGGGFGGRPGLVGNPLNYVRDEELDDSYEGLLELSERIGQVKEKRVPASIISSLPSVVYTEGMFNSEDKKEDDNNKCSVCLCEYETGEELKGLPCTHYFHDVCIEKWLGMNESCPICRIVVRG